MSCSITCSTKVHTLAKSLFFLFISVDTLCKFTMMLGVYTLLFPQEELHFFPEGEGCTHLAAHSSKRFKPLSDEAANLRHSSRSYPFNYLTTVFQKFYLVHSWILCPICNPSFLGFSVSMSLSNLFLINFSEFLALYFECGC